MSKKYLIAASVFAFVSVSTAQAADVIVPRQPKQVVSSVIASPTFSWTGFYFGGQIGGFSSKISAKSSDFDATSPSDPENEHLEWTPLEGKYVPKLSGFIGGIYAGANVEFSRNFILGVDTDILFSERKDTKTVLLTEDSDGVAFDDVDKVSLSHTLKQKWVGATRVRIGYAADCIMPYIAGGIAYGQFQDVLSGSGLKKNSEVSRAIQTSEDADSISATFDDTRTMVGFTLGAGVDFAVTHNILLRAEYRYSDFGKKKFSNMVDIDYKTNDFRVGIAYKF
ncbi:outer membrane protein [Bartonella sp. B17]